MLRLLLAVLMFAGFAGPALAQNPVHRCVGSDGSPVFTDQPCASMDATPTVAPAVASTAAPGATASSVPILCATSVAALRRAVAEAFASRDANRLSGLVLWNGYAQHTAVVDIQSLSNLLRQTLLDFGTSGDTPEGGEPAASHDLLVRTTSGSASGTPLETRFGIVRQAGCLWLQP
jgi:hypothetical protein